MSAGRAARLALAALLAASIPGGTARAEAGAAEALFAEGRDAMARGDYVLARSRLEASYRAEPAVGTLLNLAVCEERLGRLVAALAKLREARSRAQAEDERLPSIDARILEIEKRTPSVSLLAAAPLPADVTLSLDSAALPVEALGRPIPLDPGRHEVACTSAGERVCAHVVDLEERRHVEVRLDLPAARSGEPPRAPPPREVDSSSGSRRTYGHLAGALGLSALVVGIAGGAQVLHYKGVMAEHCDRHGCDDEGLAAASSGRTWAHVGTVGTILGIVGLGSSAWLLFTPEPAAGAGARVVARGRF